MRFKLSVFQYITFEPLIFLNYLMPHIWHTVGGKYLVNILKELTQINRSTLFVRIIIQIRQPNGII